MSNFFALSTWAAPFPGMGSSYLNSISEGVFLHRWGFELKANPALWEGQESPPFSLDKDFGLHLVNKNNKRYSFSMKMDQLTKEQNVEIYAKKWMKNYSGYGFEVLGSQIFQVNNARGIVIDLSHPLKQKELRQVVFVRRTTAVILTCAGDRKDFKSLMNECNQLLKTFSWVSIDTFSQ